MFTTQDPDPRKRKVFFLWRPLAALWSWLVPPSVAHADRQPRVARFIAAGLLVALVLGVVVYVLMNARVWHRAYRHWQSSNLVEDAEKFEKLAEDYREQQKPMEYQDTMVKAFRYASEAFTKNPDSPEAIRVAARIYTRAGANESRWLWSRLEKLNALTDDDVAWRIQSLTALKEDKTAGDQIEQVLRERPPSQKIVEIADTVMQRLGRSEQLLAILRSYAARKPDDLETRLVLGMRLVQFGSPKDKAEGTRLLWEMAAGETAVGLRAVEFLDTLPHGAPDTHRLIARLEGHPLAKEAHRIAALKRRVQLEPGRKQEILRQAVETRRGMARDDRVPLARWLYQERDAEKILALLREDEVRDHPALLHDYFNALSLLHRYDDLERLVKDPRCRFTNAERDFHMVHLAFVKNTLTKQPNDDIDRLLVTAVNSAMKESQVRMLLELGRYAEMRKRFRTALEAYKVAAGSPAAEREAYEGMLRSSYHMGSMKDYAAITRETARRWPSHQYFAEQFLYASLLSGEGMETMAEQARVLLEARPKDSQRKLLMALASYRFGDRAECARHLQNTTPQDLTPGQRAVFSGLARSAGFGDEAGKLAAAIPEDTPMLPEEEKFLRLARGPGPAAAAAGAPGG